MSEFMRVARGARALRIAVLSFGLIAVPLAFADTPPSTSSDSKATATQSTGTNILASIYRSGNARLMYGDVNGASSAFKLVHEVAPTLNDGIYGLAVASILSDFNKRADMLPFLSAANASDPANPIGQILAVFADPAASDLRPDGALYLSSAGAQRLKDAAGKLPSDGNLKYLASFLTATEGTGDSSFPARIPNFKRVLGQNGTVLLPGTKTEVRFGQLFTENVASTDFDKRFSPFEGRIIERLQNGLESLSDSNDSLRRVRTRIQQLQQQLESSDPQQRADAVQSLQKLLGDLDDIIAKNETTLATLKPIADNLGDRARMDAQLAEKKKELDQLQAANDQAKKLGQGLAVEIEQKKTTLSQTEQQLIAKKKALDDAQSKLNHLEEALATKNSQLTQANQNEEQAAEAVAQHNKMLADLAAKEAELKKAQEAASQLDQIKAQQAAAAQQLEALRAQLKSAEATKQGSNGALQRQEADLTAKVAELQKQQQAGEQARQQAEQVKQQLALMQSQKSQLEGDLQKEQSNYAELKDQNEKLAAQLSAREDALKKQQQEAEQLDQIKAQQTAAAQQLETLRAQVKQAEASKQDNLSTLQQQEAALSSKVDDLQKEAAEGEKARQQAEQVKQELAQVQSQKASAEGDLQKEQQNLAALKAQNEKLAAEVASRQDALKQQQLAAQQLDQIKAQQAAAAAELEKTRSEVAQTQSSGQVNVAALKQQENELAAKVADLQKSEAAGEQAKQQAQQVQQQLADMQSKKAAAEADLQKEQANLAALKAQSEQLESDLVAMQKERDAAIAEKARNAQLAKQVDFGRYVALLIGNDDYKNWEKLKTAVNDTTAIGDLLKKKYGFEVTQLKNATRGDIINKLDDLADELGPGDNLLVYYAGHGVQDGSGGYWVPVDADPVVQGRAIRTENLVRNEDVIAAIQRIRAKQVMVIADSCFSGGLTRLAIADMGTPHNEPPGAVLRGGVQVVQDTRTSSDAGGDLKAVTDQPEKLVEMEHWASRAARVVLTSGGNEPVIDTLNKGDQHSVFAQALLDVLSKNTDMLKSIELTSKVRDQVATRVQIATKNKVDQTPNFTYLGGYDGDFLFVARN